MLKDYILANELAHKMNFKIGNISIALRSMIEGIDYLKWDKTVLININSDRLPKYIKNKINDYEYTNLEGYIPLMYIKNIINNISVFNSFRTNKNLESFELHKKYFIKFKGELEPLNIVKNKNYIVFLTDIDESESLLRENKIEGFVNITKSKSLSYYKK